MKTRTTLLAALLFAGASQAALAQDHDHDHSADRPQVHDHAAPGPAPAAPHSAPIAPQGGHARLGAPSGPGAVAPPAAAPAGPAHFSHDGDHHGDSRNDGHWDRDRSSFAPGGTAPGDRRWDRADAPREVVPPTNGEHGWDRDHDGHAADPRALDHDGRNWGRDHHGPPPNWQHWERGRFPPVYSASQRFRIGPYRPPYGFFVRSWAFGDFLPRNWFGPSYWVDDYYDYGLPWPPAGYHWVRVGGDVLLVDDYSGRIVQVVRDMFW